MVKSIHKYISVFYLLVFLFPAGIQFAHSFEHHHTAEAISKTEKSFSQKEINCSVFHQQVELQSNDIDFYNEPITHVFSNSDFGIVVIEAKAPYDDNKSSRAPPCVIS